MEAVRSVGDSNFLETPFVNVYVHPNFTLNIII